MVGIYTYKRSGDLNQCDNLLGLAKKMMGYSIEEMNRRELLNNSKHMIIDNGRAFVTVQTFSDGNNKVFIHVNEDEGSVENETVRGLMLHCRLEVTVLKGGIASYEKDPAYVALEPIPIDNTETLKFHCLYNFHTASFEIIKDDEDKEYYLHSNHGTDLLDSEKTISTIQKKTGFTYVDKMADHILYDKWVGASTVGVYINDDELIDAEDKVVLYLDYFNNTNYSHFFDAYNMGNFAYMSMVMAWESQEYVTYFFPKDEPNEDGVYYDGKVALYFDSAQCSYLTPSYISALNGDRGYFNNTPLQAAYEKSIIVAAGTTTVLPDFRHLGGLGRETIKTGVRNITISTTDQETGEVTTETLSINPALNSAIFPFRCESKNQEQIINSIGEDYPGEPDSFFFRYPYVDPPSDDDHDYMKVPTDDTFTNFFLVNTRALTPKMFGDYTRHYDTWTTTVPVHSHNWLIHPFCPFCYTDELENVANTTNDGEYIDDDVIPVENRLNSFQPLTRTYVQEMQLSVPNHMTLCIRSFFANTDNAISLAGTRTEYDMEWYPVVVEWHSDGSTGTYGYDAFCRRRKQGSAKQVATETSQLLSCDNAPAFMTVKGDVVDVNLLSSIYAISNFKDFSKYDMDLSDRHETFSLPTATENWGGTGHVPSLQPVSSSRMWPKFLDGDWEYKNAYGCGVTVESFARISGEMNEVDGITKFWEQIANISIKYNNKIDKLLAGESIYDSEDSPESAIVNAIYRNLEDNGYDIHQPVSDIRIEADLYDCYFDKDTGEPV